MMLYVIVEWRGKMMEYYYVLVRNGWFGMRGWLAAASSCSSYTDTFFLLFFHRKLQLYYYKWRNQAA